MAKRAAPKGTKTYILELRNGNTRKITIPDNWKLTFGNVVPFSGKGYGGSDGKVALRLYEGDKDNLRAVMMDVVSIRDSSIQIMERRTSVQRKNAQKKTAQGEKEVVVEARVTEWVNPDAEDDTEVPQEFLRLETKKDDFNDF